MSPAVVRVSVSMCLRAWDVSLRKRAEVLNSNYYSPFLNRRNNEIDPDKPGREV